MSKILIVAMLALATITTSANAEVGERTMTGAAIGAGTGAVVAGPPGFVVGGAVVGGPRLPHHRCWRGDDGYRHCRH